MGAPSRTHWTWIQSFNAIMQRLWLMQPSYSARKKQRNLMYFCRHKACSTYRMRKQLKQAATIKNNLPVQTSWYKKICKVFFCLELKILYNYFIDLLLAIEYSCGCEQTELIWGRRHFLWLCLCPFEKSVFSLVFVVFAYIFA